MNSNPVLKYYDIADNVVAFSTTRKGGCSIGNHSSFNINHYCGDAEQAISANKDALCGLLGISSERLVLPHQTHQTAVRQIADEFFTLPERIKTMLLEGVDAVMTDVKDACIGVSTADCVPIIIYDSEHHAACVVHAGWRGTVARIAENAIKQMVLAYNTRPEALKAVIGPSISVDKFEVGDEVYKQFAEAGFPMPDISSHFDGKWHIDLWQCNKMQLERCGLLSENIEISGVCTYTQCDDYFSARRLGIESGRIYTGVVLR